MVILRRTFLVWCAALAALHGENTLETPFAGVTHIKRTETVPRSVTMHVIQIDLTQPGLRFKLTPPSGSRETVRQTTLDFLKQEKAQIAINVHFFLPFPSEDTEVYLIGLAASEGVVYSDFETPEQSYAILPDSPALNLTRDNRAQMVRRAESAELWNAISGSAQIVTRGVKTIPVYGEGGLTPGGPNNYSNADSWYERPNARTVAGITPDGRTLVFLTVDRAAGSLGLTVGEVADVLIRDYGVYDALNLDGGGSTSLALQDPKTGEAVLVNVPVDGAPGRAVGSSLAIFAGTAQ